jgi:uncharacterized membrane protein YdjX (TVP38/TMEM64 family)
MITKRTLSKKYRLIFLLILLISLYIIGKVTGVSNLDIKAIQSYVENAGYWGYGLFVSIFCAGEFVHIPGVVFFGAGILAYGKVLGSVIGFIAATASVCFSFVMVRSIGGKVLDKIERPFFKKILQRLDEKPIRAIIILRTCLWMFPPLNYTLALSSVRFRDYLIGSAIGLVLPLALVSICFDWIFAHCM